MASKVPFGEKCFKYFIGYKDNEKMVLLCVIVPKRSVYRKKFDETKYMSFLIKGNEFQEKYNQVWDKVSNAIKKGFDSGPVHNEKFLKIQMKSDEGKANTNFHNDKMSKEGSYCICVSVILIDSVFLWVKSVILKCFCKNINTLLKKKSD